MSFFSHGRWNADYVGPFYKGSIVMQLPIIIAAIFAITDFESPLNAELWPSVLSGILLLVFSLIGSGPWSLDHYLAQLKQD